MLNFSMILTNAAFAGRLGDPTMLAAVGLGNVMCLVCLITMFMGLNAAQDSLTSQYYGSGNVRQCGVLLNRGFVINLVCYLPLAVTTGIYGERILVALGQDLQESKVAFGYIKYCLPGQLFAG